MIASAQSFFDSNYFNAGSSLWFASQVKATASSGQLGTITYASTPAPFQLVLTGGVVFVSSNGTTVVNFDILGNGHMTIFNEMQWVGHNIGAPYSTGSIDVIADANFQISTGSAKQLNFAMTNGGNVWVDPLSSFMLNADITNMGYIRVAGGSKIDAMAKMPATITNNGGMIFAIPDSQSGGSCACMSSATINARFIGDSGVLSVGIDDANNDYGRFSFMGSVTPSFFNSAFAGNSYATTFNFRSALDTANPGQLGKVYADVITLNTVFSAARNGYFQMFPLETPAKPADYDYSSYALVTYLYSNSTKTMPCISNDPMTGDIHDPACDDPTYNTQDEIDNRDSSWKPRMAYKHWVMNAVTNENRFIATKTVDFISGVSPLMPLVSLFSLLVSLVLLL
jgi:hypothetical protein